MIIDYNDSYYEYLNDKIVEFNISFLKNNNPFLCNCLYIVNNIPVGFMSYALIYDRIELEYIWIDTDYRRKGIASILIDKMLSVNGIKNVTLEVAVDNIGAISLYEKKKFKIVAVRKNYYGNKDAYLMVREMVK